MDFKRISLITPSFNLGNYLEETILSILDQNYPNLEYIIIDGGSTDNSVDIIKKYESRLAYWVSEPDNGMYHALQKGFEKSTGEIMGWINADDMLHKNSLFSVAELLSLRGVHWIQGTSTMYDESGRTIRVGNSGSWSPLRQLTDKGCIQQESTFWSRELWNRAGGYISTEYQMASDFELWSRFFQYEKLYTPTCLIGGFRMRREGNLSMIGDKYEAEKELIKKNLLKNEVLAKKESTQRYWLRMKSFLKKSRILNWHFLTNRIDRRIKQLHGFPPELFFNRETQKFELSQSIP